MVGACAGWDKRPGHLGNCPEKTSPVETLVRLFQMGSLWVKVAGGFIEDESPGVQSCTEELGSDYESHTSLHSEPPKLHTGVYLPAFFC